jgi:Ca2+-transporting ATPase
MTVKGAPDVVLERCGTVLWHGEVVAADQVRDELLAANQQLSEQGLRVLAFAARDLDEPTVLAADQDPMSTVRDLMFIALVGIIDLPRRQNAVRTPTPESTSAITGDHTVTARTSPTARLGPGVITGTELAALSDADLRARLPQPCSAGSRPRTSCASPD